MLDEKQIKELVRDDYTDQAKNIGKEIDTDALADLIIKVSKKIIKEIETATQIIFEDVYHENPVDKAVM